MAHGLPVAVAPMRRAIGIVSFLVFLLAIAINCEQTIEATTAKNSSSNAVMSFAEFSDTSAGSQLLTADDDADRIATLTSVGDRISVDDFEFFPLIISKAILHPAYANQPTVLRL